MQILFYVAPVFGNVLHSRTVLFSSRHSRPVTVLATKALWVVFIIATIVVTSIWKEPGRDGTAEVTKKMCRKNYRK